MELTSAISYLRNPSAKTGTNLYDHLVRLVGKILDERPTNSIDELEEISQKEKKSKEGKGLASSEENQAHAEVDLAFAQVQEKLFASAEEREEDIDTPLPNILEISYYFEQGGIGLNREEVVRIWLALKELVDNYPLQHVRFWGKIFGIEQNYIVAEVEFREGEGEDDDDAEEDSEDGEDVAEKDEEEDEDEDDAEEALPKLDYTPPPRVPQEERRTGTNKKTYFVCHDPGQPWLKLPLVTPAQICAARDIRKFLTGRLDAPVVSFPPFPGREASLLRAQIARISASTHISPVTFFEFDDDDNQSDQDTPLEIVENVAFQEDGIRVSELVDESLSKWVHHVQCILPQGRCLWWDPATKDVDDFDEDEAVDDDDDEEGRSLDRTKEEEGPPLLTPISGDSIKVERHTPCHLPTWTPRLSSKLLKEHAIAIMDSNIWPGAHAFCTGKVFENVYIGWGLKYSAENYSPRVPPPVMDEYQSGLDITEDDDPTPEMEAEARAAVQEVAEQMEEGYEEDDEDD